MRRNVAGQFVGAQLISKTDGSPITSGTTTVYVTGDAGTQAAGSVGSGACTHEGNGYWTYAPAQAETNYTQVAFTFVNTSACNVTVQLYPISYDASGQMSGVGLAADQAVNVTKVNGTVQTARDLGATLGVAGAGLTALGDTRIANLDATISSRTKPADTQAAVTVVGSVSGAVGSVTAGVTVTTNNDKTGYGLSAAAVQAIWDALTSALTMVGSIGKKLADWTVGTIDTYTGNTKQTGDAFARLGAPAGASVSADVAAVKTDTAAVKVQTDKLVFSTANQVDAKIVNAAAGGIVSGAHAAAELNAIGDAMLDRNMATGVDSGTDSTSVRTARQALRILRNKRSVAGGVLTVTKENDATASWTAAVATTPGDPTSGIDPT